MARSAVVQTGGSGGAHMSTFFQKIDATKRKVVEIKFKVSQEEKELIDAAAFSRNIGRSEFLRRVSLAKRVDTRYENQVVLELRILAQLLHQIHEIHQISSAVHVVWDEEKWQFLYDTLVESIRRSRA